MKRTLGDFYCSTLLVAAWVVWFLFWWRAVLRAPDESGASPASAEM
jgi:hypothetical protein